MDIQLLCVRKRKRKSMASKSSPLTNYNTIYKINNAIYGNDAIYKTNMRGQQKTMAKLVDSHIYIARSFVARSN